MAAAVAEDNRLQILEGLFPEYDLVTLVQNNPTSSVEQISDWILNNVDKIQKKKKVLKRKLEPENADISVLNITIDNDSDDIANANALDNFIKEMLNFLKEELSLQNNISIANKSGTINLIGAAFYNLRIKFIKLTFQEMGYRICATLIACWFVANKLNQKLKNFMENSLSAMWIHDDILKSPRKNNYINIFNPQLYASYVEETRQEADKFVSIINKMQTKYPNIVNKLKLLIIPKEIQTFSCGVCFDEFNISHQITCGGTSQKTESTDDAATQQQTFHSFCRECVRNQAQAATEDMQLAEGGIGLKCMEFNCKNAIFFSSVRHFIPRKVRKRIDERMAEENLGKAGLILERCRECNFAIEMAESKEQNKVFACPNCEKNWCRLCEREWDDEHFGITCAKLDAKNKVDKKQRELEKRLNEVVIRKCKCGLQFTKSEGCNKMTCRCGATQCYICRKTNIEYSHFCNHVKNPEDIKCKICKNKTCMLWEDSTKADQAEIDRIKAEVEAENKPPPKLAPLLILPTNSKRKSSIL